MKLLFYVRIRNTYLESPKYRLLEATNTILVTDISMKDLPRLEDLYSIFPSRVRSVYINRDLSTLSKKL